MNVYMCVDIYVYVDVYAGIYTGICIRICMKWPMYPLKTDLSYSACGTQPWEYACNVRMHIHTLT